MNSNQAKCYVQIIEHNMQHMLHKNEWGTFIIGKVDEAVLFEVRQRLAWLLDIGEEHVNIP